MAGPLPTRARYRLYRCGPAADGAAAAEAGCRAPPKRPTAVAPAAGAAVAGEVKGASCCELGAPAAAGMERCRQLAMERWLLLPVDEAGLAASAACSTAKKQRQNVPSHGTA